MPFVSRRFGFAYFPIPKNGGTSIRHALHALETGRPFAPATLPSGGATEPWMHHPAVPFRDLVPADFAPLQRIVVVRHPFDRFVSAFRNRVGHHREIERADFGRLGIDGSVPKDPDFDAFCRHLDAYRRIPSIRHHIEPQATFIGEDLSWFTHVFRLERIAALEHYLSRLAGGYVTLPRLRAEGTPRERIAISDASRAVVAAHCRRDLALLRGLYG